MSPRSLRDLAGQVFREHRRQEHLTLAELRQRWAGLVGPGLAERTWPARLQQATLWIAAPDSSWAYQLQFLKQEILGHLRANFPASPITELRFTVGEVPGQQGPGQPTPPDTGAPPPSKAEAIAPPPVAAPALSPVRLALRALAALRPAPAAPAATAVPVSPTASVPNSAQAGGAHSAPSSDAQQRSDFPPPPPELLRAAETIADPELRAAFLRTLAKQARLARKPD